MAKTSTAQNRSAPVPIECRSQVRLVGRIKREAQKPQGDGTPFSFLTVETEVAHGGDGERIERLFHDVCGFGDVARHLAKAFDVDDVVQLTGRLAYRNGRKEDDPRSHRIVVQSADDIRVVDGGTLHEVAVEIVGTVTELHRGESKKGKVPFFRATVTASIDRDDREGTVEIEHKILAFDQAAVMAGDLGLSDDDAVLVTGRLNRTATDKDRTSWEPTILVDDITGSIERAV